jgi:hypothetical protein
MLAPLGPDKTMGELNRVGACPPDSRKKCCETHSTHKTTHNTAEAYGPPRTILHAAVQNDTNYFLSTGRNECRFMQQVPEIHKIHRSRKDSYFSASADAVAISLGAAPPEFARRVSLPAVQAPAPQWRRQVTGDRTTAGPSPVRCRRWDHRSAGVTRETGG